MFRRKEYDNQPGLAPKTSDAQETKHTTKNQMASGPSKKLRMQTDSSKHKWSDQGEEKQLRRKGLTINFRYSAIIDSHAEIVNLSNHSVRGSGNEPFQDGATGSTLLTLPEPNLRAHDEERSYQTKR
jgi:hypothetical protein